MSTSDGLTIVGFVITLGVAIVGWAWLRRSDQRTAEALRLAQSAEDRAQRLEDQAVESRDVRWDLPGHEEARLTLTNVGTDIAARVVVTIDFQRGDFPREVREFATVGPGECATVNLEHQVGEHRRLHATLDAYSQGFEAGPLELVVTVKWSSPLGVPDHDTFKRIDR